MTPASTREDLPLPEAPTTTSTPVAASRRRHAASSARAPEEGVPVVLVVGLQPLVGAALRCGGPVRWAQRGAQRGIVGQDGGLEADQFGAGLDAELVCQHHPSLVQCPQGFALPPSPIQRQRQQCPSLLAERLGGGERARCADDVAVLGERQTCLHETLLGTSAQLDQTSRFGRTRRPAVEVRERLALPQRQRAVEHVGCPIVFAQLRQLGRPVNHVLEAPRVDVVVAGHEAVAIGSCLDGPGAEHLAQANDRVLHHLAPGSRRVAPPHRVGQLIRMDHLAPPDDQHRQQRSVPWRHSGLAVQGDRAEDADAHRPEHVPVGRTGQRRRYRTITRRGSAALPLPRHGAGLTTNKGVTMKRTTKRALALVVAIVTIAAAYGASDPSFGAGSTAAASQQRRPTPDTGTSGSRRRTPRRRLCSPRTATRPNQPSASYLSTSTRNRSAAI